MKEKELAIAAAAHYTKSNMSCPPLLQC